MANYSNLPAPTPEGGLSRYLQEIRKFPMLEHEEEYMLGRRWVEKQDKRPSVLFSASTTNQSWCTSLAFALKVFMHSPTRPILEERGDYSSDGTLSIVKDG